LGQVERCHSRASGRVTRPQKPGWVPAVGRKKRRGGITGHDARAPKGGSRAVTDTTPILRNLKKYSGGGLRWIPRAWGLVIRRSLLGVAGSGVQHGYVSSAPTGVIPSRVFGGKVELYVKSKWDSFRRLTDRSSCEGIFMKGRGSPVLLVMTVEALDCRKGAGRTRRWHTKIWITILLLGKQGTRQGPEKMVLTTGKHRMWACSVHHLPESYIHACRGGGGDLVEKSKE